MLCQFSFSGFVEKPEGYTVELDFSPQVGDTIYIPTPTGGKYGYVRNKTWYIQENDEGERLERPLLYISVGANPGQ